MTDTLKPAGLAFGPYPGHMPVTAFAVTLADVVSYPTDARVPAP
jgi:hypothetical protein